MTRVLLIRHGETRWNRERRWQGHRDVPLSDEGRVQAADLARRLASETLRPDALYSSDLSRSLDTARAVGEALGLPVQTDPVWREFDVGSWSGLTRAEIRDRHADAWARIAAGEDLPRGGGERMADVVARVHLGLDGVRRRHPDGLVLVVSHGGILRIARLLSRGLPQQRLREIPVPENGQSVELVSDGERWVEAPLAETAAAR